MNPLKKGYIYLRGEYQFLKADLEKELEDFHKKLKKQNQAVEIWVIGRCWEIGKIKKICKEYVVIEKITGPGEVAIPYHAIGEIQV